MSDQDDLSLEEQYGFRERKERREERKMASRRDRSQYKKTDQDKKKKASKPKKEGLLKGRVIEIMSQEARVDCDGTIYICVLRGAFKKERTRMKNLLAVGDLVLVEPSGAQEGLIVHVEERTSELSRADNLSRRKQQIIASNVEQVLITTAVVDPPIKPFLIDRYIIAAQKGNMRPVIVVNKIDLLEEEEYSEELREEEALMLEAALEAYQAIDIPILLISVEQESGLEELHEIMKGSVSVFSGQSGVGKSSLINAVTGLELETGETVKKTRKGAHTTTAAKLIRLAEGGWCVDTPGIKSFGVWDLQEEEIERFYTEIHEKGRDCRFSSCTHLHEPNCAVQEAVEAGEISELRYASYCQLIESVRSKHFRR